MRWRWVCWCWAVGTPSLGPTTPARDCRPPRQAAPPRRPEDHLTPPTSQQRPPPYALSMKTTQVRGKPAPSEPPPLPPLHKGGKVMPAQAFSPPCEGEFRGG